MGLEEEVLEGALLNALQLYHALETARSIVAEADTTVFGSLELAFVEQTICKAMSHLRSCQWHGAS